ncbi:MAG TPA: tetratricopeptide repeat protein [Gemmatimonadota bacterium]|nr:tetratricopeptide repeat protein [Gemmatimonadota bacterium]
MSTLLTLLEVGLMALTAAPADTVPLYDNLGDHHYEISTDNPLTQQYFDQGLRLVWAFNHAEAIRSFQEAARLDPECAMCWWGIAYAYGPNINAPMDSTSGVAAWNAVQKALELKEHAGDREDAFIDAVATRYAEVPPAERAALDSAWARAMDEVAERYPDDLEAATVSADARMNLSPWFYWTHDGELRPGHDVTLDRLERAIAADSTHPGACHLYIHAVEATEPERAVPCAERLAGLMPGAGHIVHMPAHIYIRVGRYNDAIEANVHAVHTDETYIMDTGPTGIYPAFYYPHNYHFLSFASMHAGQAGRALETARESAAKMDHGLARQFGPEAARMLAHPHLTLIAFGRWEETLAEPQPPADIPFATGLVHYARGVANAALERFDDAQAELEAVSGIAAEFTEGWPATVMQIAIHSLNGDIAYRQGDYEAAIAHYEQAKELEDTLIYTEPAYWNRPIRRDLGAALLAAGRPAEAETAYAEELGKFPDNGWSLYGIIQAFEAQGKAAEAEAARERFQLAWEKADISLTASRL